MSTRRLPRLPLLAIAVAVALAILASAAVTPALAADEPSGYRNVLLSIYPEYDDPLNLGYPALLVMIEGEIQGTAPPTTVRFLVPDDARMYSAGSGPRDKYVGGPPDQKPSDIAGWDEISYQLKTTYFVVEYYVPVPTSPDKVITAEFIPLFPVDRLTAIVQQPRQATDFNVLAQTPPVSQRQSTDGQGFNVQRYSYNSLKSRESLVFNVSYTKTGRAPSLQTRDSSSDTILIVLAVAVVAALALLFARGWLRSRSSSRRRTKGRAANRHQAGKSAPGRFCPKCGASLDASQRFCPKCGTKQRQQTK